MVCACSKMQKLDLTGGGGLTGLAPGHTGQHWPCGMYGLVGQSISGQKTPAQRSLSSLPYCGSGALTGIVSGSVESSGGAGTPSLISPLFSSA